MKKKGFIDVELLAIVGIIMVAIVTFSLLFLLVQPFPLFKYGEGSTYGVMTTVEEGIFFDSVWIRAEYESSQTDQYCLEEDSPIKEIMKWYIQSKQRVELKYKKHFLGSCGDLVIGVNPIMG